MKTLLDKFLSTAPEIVFEWNDPLTEAQGFLVINSLRGGAAGGGTRMRLGLDRNEVEALAKTMEVKFAVCGPQIGGAKSGINFDPTRPEKRDVLKRWFKAVMPIFKEYYGTGGDLNVDEMHDVIPITEEFGLVHPQEGIVNGHFSATRVDTIDRLAQLRRGVCRVIESADLTPSVEHQYTVADLITGYGVFQALNHFYRLWGGNISGKRVLVQGWGNVGAIAAYYLASEGARVVGIMDREGGIINQDGLGLKNVRELVLNRNGNSLVCKDKIPYGELNEQFWDQKAEIFIPAAASKLVSKEQADKLVASGIEVISCGANVPFQEKANIFGPVTEYLDSKVAVLPDFIANCGMARVFAYLMQKGVKVKDHSIFEDVSNVIGKALEETYEQNSGVTNITKTALEQALQKIM
ncbi:MAG: amino acid dehydrogenase [Deltaproteobacteria bacterium]|nr:amino acid dehydrogenase [Deltaproteobacteria bacterium]